MTAHNIENRDLAGGPRSASAAARSLKNAKRKRGSAQPQERGAQARQRAASRKEIDRPYSVTLYVAAKAFPYSASKRLHAFSACGSL
jgi:hypothetical protein